MKAVTPFLNEAVGENNWMVDTDHPEKILSITNGQNDAGKVISAVEKAGFKIEEK